MLIIRRRQGEAILIGENVEVRVVEVGAGRVKLGISAPAEVLILREEIRLGDDARERTASACRSQHLIHNFDSNHSHPLR